MTTTTTIGQTRRTSETTITQHKTMRTRKRDGKRQLLDGREEEDMEQKQTIWIAIAIAITMATIATIAHEGNRESVHSHFWPRSGRPKSPVQLDLGFLWGSSCVECAADVGRFW